jgi:hypothetical protein
MGDLGMVTLLPVSAVCALTVLGLCYCLALVSHTRPPWLLGLLLGTTIFLLYGLTAMVESEPRFAPVWRHAGFVDYLLRTGHLDSRIDVYFSWPGFFTALAFLSSVSGTHDVYRILAAANWAPVFFNLAYTTVLYALFSSLTRDDRVRWLALWFFVVSNWIAQDYLAPQAMAYLLYLVIVTLLIAGLSRRYRCRVGGASSSWSPYSPPSSRSSPVIPSRHFSSSRQPVSSRSSAASAPAGSHSCSWP